FAGIDPEEFYVFTEVRPHVRIVNGNQRKIDWPANDFFYHRSARTGRHYILLHGIEPQLHWQEFTNTIVDVAKQHQVKLVLTLGGLLAAVPHSQPARLTGSSSDLELNAQMLDLKSMGTPYQGPTGILGVLNTACNEAGIPTASIWGNVPHYLQASPNLKVASALLRRMDSLLSMRINLASADAMATRFDNQVAEAVARNPEIASYVHQLEAQQEDETAEEQTPTAGADLPSGEALVQELEEFLRRRQDDPDENAH
ncbi:MAG: PAC2 family protein, partial [Chloroflexi bacterium]|nr:PAC2 family protein [Chloroflexota bacterium]